MIDNNNTLNNLDGAAIYINKGGNSVSSQLNNYLTFNNRGYVENNGQLTNGILGNMQSYASTSTKRQDLQQTLVGFYQNFTESYNFETSNTYDPSRDDNFIDLSEMVEDVFNKLTTLKNKQKLAKQNQSNFNLQRELEDAEIEYLKAVKVLVNGKSEQGYVNQRRLDVEEQLLALVEYEVATINNQDSGVLINNGKIVNNTVFNNHQGALMLNKGQVDNGGIVVNSGRTINQSNGLLNNDGVIFNGGLQQDAVSLLQNPEQKESNSEGYLLNLGALNNAGKLINPGVMHNAGILQNSADALISNASTFINDDLLENSGKIYSSGNFFNRFELINNGDLVTTGHFYNGLERSSVMQNNEPSAAEYAAQNEYLENLRQYNNVLTKQLSAEQRLVELDKAVSQAIERSTFNGFFGYSSDEAENRIAAEKWGVFLIEKHLLTSVKMRRAADQWIASGNCPSGISIACYADYVFSNIDYLQNNSTGLEYTDKTLQLLVSLGQSAKRIANDAATTISQVSYTNASSYALFSELAEIETNSLSRENRYSGYLTSLANDIFYWSDIVNSPGAAQTIARINDPIGFAKDLYKEWLITNYLGLDDIFVPDPRLPGYENNPNLHSSLELDDRGLLSILDGSVFGNELKELIIRYQNELNGQLAESHFSVLLAQAEHQLHCSQLGFSELCNQLDQATVQLKTVPRNLGQAASLDNSGTITVESEYVTDPDEPSGNLILEQAGILENFTLLQNNQDGIINIADKDSQLLNHENAVFINNGEVINEGLILNNSLFNNTGSLTVGDNGMLTNNGFFESSGVIVNLGSFNNNAETKLLGQFTNSEFSEVTNNGKLMLMSSSFSNSGIIDNTVNGEIVVRADLAVDGLLVNSGDLIVYGDSQYINDGEFINYGQLTNNGVFINKNLLSSQHTGIFNNFGMMQHDGNSSSTSGSDWFNGGKLVNEDSGVIVLNNSFINDSAGILYNKGLLNINTVEFSNSGLIDNQQDATINVNASISIGGDLINNGLINIADSELFTMIGGGLSGNGIFDGNVFLDGTTVSPGNSPGTLSFMGDYLRLSDVDFMLEIGRDLDTGGLLYDSIMVAGDLWLDTAIDLFIELLDGVELADLDGVNFNFIDVAGSILNGAGDVIDDLSNWAVIITEGWTGNWLNTNGLWSLELSYANGATPPGDSVDVPEPSSLVLMALAMLLLIQRRQSLRLTLH